MKIYKSKVYNVDIEEVNIKLSIDLDEFSNPYNNEGYIEITSVNIPNENCCFWDNLNFFIYNNKEIIKKECEQELIDKNLYVEEIFDIIKKLTSTAILENMLIRTYKND